MNKRVFRRIVVTFPVEVEVKAKEPFSDASSGISGETVDLSGEGVGLFLKKPLTKSSSFILRIDLSPRYPSVEIEAQPIWYDSIAKAGRFRCGIRFLEPQAVNRIELSRVINEIMKLKATFWRRNLNQFLVTVRDLLIPFMPKFIVRLLVGKGDFVFLAHALDLSDFARKYPFADKMSKRNIKIFSRNLWPIIGSKITGFKKRDGSCVNGWIVFCPLTTRMMILKREVAREKIVKATKFAEKLGAKVIGLGAFIPILTEDGQFLADKVRTNITSGAAFSAITAVQNVLKIVDVMDIKETRTKIAIVGAGGSVGSICSKMLARKFKEVLLVDKNMKSLDKLVREINLTGAENEGKILISRYVRDIRDADIIIAVTSAPGVVVRSSHLKPGAVIIDAAQPKNVSAKIPKERKDVLVIESGVIEVNGLKTNFNLGLRKESEVFSCLAEVLLMIWMERKCTYLGKIDSFYIQELWSAAKDAGIKLADFRNNLGFIKDEEIKRIKNMRRRNINFEGRNRK